MLCLSAEGKANETDETKKHAPVFLTGAQGKIN
jgi:hypothetical protein